jgi:hypothetical protein
MRKFDESVFAQLAGKSRLHLSELIPSEPPVRKRPSLIITSSMPVGAKVVDVRDNDFTIITPKEEADNLPKIVETSKGPYEMRFYRYILEQESCPCCKQPINKVVGYRVTYVKPNE